ncbi:Protein ROS1 [Raphanus sativus]|nr:Protein ROS1 [Raphanus sativus]
MQAFLNQVQRDHNNCLDLEWYVEPHKSKQYPLSFLRLGPKCLDCVRLLTLHQRAFPSKAVLSHTRYELHYQMNTFRKVFCTKSEPNCKACPMRGECKHFACTCGRLSLPNSEKGMGTSDKVSPELNCPQISIGDIEDVPMIGLNKDGSTRKVKEILKHNKYISSLKTDHEVYILPDSHHLLAEVYDFPKREIDDPNSYLLAIWTPGNLECDDATSFSCNNIRDTHSQIVRGTILIPCRTALENRFALNGTFFQINEVYQLRQFNNASRKVIRELQ